MITAFSVDVGGVWLFLAYGSCLPVEVELPLYFAEWLARKQIVAAIPAEWRSRGSGWRRLLTRVAFPYPRKFILPVEVELLSYFTEWRTRDQSKAALPTEWFLPVEVVADVC